MTQHLADLRKTRAALLDIIDDKSVGIIEEDKARNHKHGSQRRRPSTD